MVKITLAEARKHAGLTRAELAKKLGINIHLVDYYTSGRNVPGADIFLKICKVCNVDPYDVEIGGKK